jgi:hypothetical protein
VRTSLADWPPALASSDQVRRARTRARPSKVRKVEKESPLARAPRASAARTASRHARPRARRAKVVAARRLPPSSARAFVRR